MVSPVAKRRIARQISMLPLLFCICGWVWSHLYTERVCYTGCVRDWSAEVAIGKLVVWSGASMRVDSGWSYVHMHPDWEIAELYTGLPDWRFLGFHFFCGAHGYSPGVTAVLLVIPFWMLCVAAGVPPVWMWWKAQKRQNACGFSIEASSVDDP